MLWERLWSDTFSTWTLHQSKASQQTVIAGGGESVNRLSEDHIKGLISIDGRCLPVHS